MDRKHKNILRVLAAADMEVEAGNLPTMTAGEVGRVLLDVFKVDMSAQTVGAGLKSLRCRGLVNKTVMSEQTPHFIDHRGRAHFPKYTLWGITQQGLSVLAPSDRTKPKPAPRKPVARGGRPYKADPKQVLSWRLRCRASVEETSIKFGISRATVHRYCAKKAA